MTIHKINISKNTNITIPENMSVISKELPVTSIKDFIKIIKKHKNIIRPFVNDDISNELLELTKKLNKTIIDNSQIKKELKTKNDKITKLEELVELNNKKTGTHSMFKGEFEEKNKELFLNEYFGNIFDIDGSKKMKCMDIRMTHKIKKYTLGIECKDKKIILKKQDINKFHLDKLECKFRGCIFISVNSNIPGYVDKINHFSIKNKNELYIYSDDSLFVKIIINVFIDYLECEENTMDRCHVETLLCVCNQWNNLKSGFLKMDKIISNYLKQKNININGQLYLVSKSKCKSSKEPY